MVDSKSAYRIFETDSFLQDLENFDRQIRTKLERKLTAFVHPRLRASPRIGPWIRKLRNWSPETWRFRIGDFRIFYEIDDVENTVFLTALSARKDAY